jgi:hypothetical protein
VISHKCVIRFTRCASLICDSGEVEGEGEWKPQEAVDREQYERLNDEGRRSWCTWKNPPPKLTN